tara:strand:+ start:136 stop:570 length:435 start_codon:yes stop_codon:yes gene_type:complete
MQKSWMGDIPNSHVRDYQRKRLYDAEDSCLFWGNIEILTWKQVEATIQKISEWAEIKSPSLVEDGHTLAYATADTISLPFPMSKTMPYIAHEMSHVINYNGSNADHHGKHFAGMYLEVVKEFIGSTAHKDLKKAFDYYKVGYSL